MSTEKLSNAAPACTDGCCCGGKTESEHNHDHGHDHDHSHDHGHTKDHVYAPEIGCGCGCEEAKIDVSERGKKIQQILMAVGAALFLAAMIFDLGVMEIPFYIAAYLLIGWEVLLTAVKNISKGHVFDENFLMAIASIGAICIKEYPEAVAVMLFYQIGEAFQDYAVGKSRRSISELMDIRPDSANVLVDGRITEVSPETVQPGAFIVVRPGEKIPLDGVVTDGASALDVSALTGESLPRDVAVGAEVLSGAINVSGMLTVQVTKPYGESTVARILELVERSGDKKAKMESYITRFARYYTPAVVIAAVLLAVVPPIVVPGAVFSDWLYRALTFLVVSCPCALVISVPLSYFGGIGGASKNGVLVKGGNYLEALAKVDTVVFDKTGTLTRGEFTVTSVVTADGVTEQELIEAAAYAESFSTHPIARSIVRRYGAEIESSRLTGQGEIAGRGVRCTLDGSEIHAGNARLMGEIGITVPDSPRAGGSVVHVAIGNTYAGEIRIEDEIKPDSKRAIEELRAANVKNIVMLTGDGRLAGEAVAQELGLDKAHCELLPDMKVDIFEEIIEGNKGAGTVAFVGDGINDAPVLARADVGVAMGGIGSDAAIEAADIVLMSDEPRKLAVAVKIARKTAGIVRQNIVFALGVKAVILVLGAMGIASMWAAVFGDVGVSLLAVLNAMRAMRTDKIAQ